MNVVRTSVLAAAVVLLAAGVPAADAQTPRLLRVVLNEYRITPASITIRSGERIRLEVQNAGTIVHEFRSTLFRGVEVLVRTQGFDVRAERFELVAVRPTWIATLEFTRRTPGEYEFFCGMITADGRKHADLGMMGKFIVLPP